MLSPPAPPAAGGPLRVAGRLLRRRARFLAGVEPPGRAWREAHAAHVAELATRPPRVLFLGDSITAGWLTVGRAAWERHFVPHGDAALGIGGDDTARLLWRLRHGGLPASPPRAAVLHIGINDLWLGYGPAATVRGVRRVVRHVRSTFPQACVVLLGLIGPRPTPDVRRVNEGLQRSATGWGVRFVDPNGALAADTVPDNVHPDAAGYAALADLLVDAVREVGVREQSPHASV